MISILDLNKTYGDKPVLKNLSWNLDEGQIHGLVGLNGSGKTTLLKIISGVIRPDSGSVMHGNIPVTKKMLTLLETEPYFYHGINGKEYLSLFKGTHGFDTPGWAELFHLPLKELVDNYSTGMRKKLALLALLKSGKPLLLLDEPFNGLDLESTRILSKVLKKLSGPGKTIIITSHMLETLGDLCDRIHYLSDGVIRKTYLQGETSVMSNEIFHEFDKQTEVKINQLLSSV